ncbi:MAG: nuclear transport factor 2 family protein [Pseudomonadota bacterium]
MAETASIPAVDTHEDPRVARWLRHAAQHDAADLRAQLAEDAVFFSPVVHTPQAGRERTFAYLDAAGHVFADSGFAYRKIIVDGAHAMLEFTAEIDGISINGIDLISWNADGEIAEFKVMVRPMKAMNMLWEKMAAMLAAADDGSSG